MQPLNSGLGVAELVATWINPTTQPIISELVKRFGLETPQDFQEGGSMVELVDGSIVKGEPTSLIKVGLFLAF